MCFVICYVSFGSYYSALAGEKMSNYFQRHSHGKNSTAKQNLQYSAVVAPIWVGSTLTRAPAFLSGQITQYKDITYIRTSVYAPATEWY